MKKAVAYLRTAVTKIGEKKDSMAEQEKIIRDFADKNKTEILQFFTDVCSGLKNFNGKPWLDLEEYILKNDVDFILVSRLDRLGRNIDIVHKKIMSIENKGKTLIHPVVYNSDLKLETYLKQ